MGRGLTLGEGEGEGRRRAKDGRSDCTVYCTDVVDVTKHPFPRSLRPAPFPRRFKDYINGGVGEGENISPSERLEKDALARTRRKAVKDGMKHAWEGYRRYAFGKDEIKPLSKTGHNPWGGMGTTLVDR